MQHIILEFISLIAFHLHSAAFNTLIYKYKTIYVYMYRYYIYTMQYNTINTYIHTYKAKNEQLNMLIP